MLSCILANKLFYLEIIPVLCLFYFILFYCSQTCHSITYDAKETIYKIQDMFTVMQCNINDKKVLFVDSSEGYFEGKDLFLLAKSLRSETRFTALSGTEEVTEIATENAYQFIYGNMLVIIEIFISDFRRSIIFFIALLSGQIFYC